MKSKNNSNKEKVLLGKVVGAQGIRGEVKIYSFGDAPSDFNKYEKALLVLPGDEEDEAMSYTVEKARIQGNLAIVKFSEIVDRNAAESMRDSAVYVEAGDLEELPDDTFYVRDLEGLSVIDDDTGLSVGVLEEVIQNAAQDVYRIKLTEGEGEALVPAVKEFIKNVDIESGTIHIHFIEGMK